MNNEEHKLESSTNEQAAKAPSQDSLDHNLLGTASSGERSADTASGQRKGFGFMASIIGLLLMIVVMVGGYFSWGFIQGQKNIFSEKIVGLEGRIGILGDELSSTKNTLRSTKEELARFQQALNGQVSDIAVIENQLASVSSKDHVDWLVNEAEYLIKLANQRLGFIQDLEGSVRLLKAADDILKELDDPNANPVRAILSDEINALSLMDNIDINGIFFRISSLSDEVDALSQVPDLPEFKEEKNSKTESVKNEWLAGFEQIIIALTPVKRSADEISPLLQEDKILFAKQNIKLMLSSSQLALLKKDEGSYRHLLKQSREQIEKIFSVNEYGVKKLISQIESLENIKINVGTPDISTSLSAIREYKLFRQKRNYDVRKLMSQKIIGNEQQVNSERK